MKYVLLFFSISIFFHKCVPQQNKPEVETELTSTKDANWTLEKEHEHLQNRNDSTTWDNAQFLTDLEARNILPPNKPFEVGVFPTPSFALLGEKSFGGVGTFGINGDGDEKHIQDKIILYNSFFVGMSDITKPFVGDENERVFFQIILLTNFVDTANYTHQQKLAFSRNHPDYMGQGQYKTQQNTIQYVAFLRPNQDSYAIINMRLFNLKQGRTILIAPQKDGSLRSMQIDSPPLTSAQIDQYTDKLLKQKEVEDFFTYHGNI